MLIYHIPGRAGVTLAPAAVERIAMRSDNLVGLKHASTDLAYLTELLIRLGPEFRAFVGQEDLSFPMLAIGAADLPAARALHFELFEINQAVFYDTNPIPMSS